MGRCEHAILLQNIGIYSRKMGRGNKRDRKLNIAMLGHKRIPSREGGIEIVVEELSTRMAAMGHCVTCYNRKGHHVSGRNFDEQTKRKLYKGVILKKVPTVNRKGLAAMTSSIMAALCAAIGRFDVVHFHAEGPCAMCWLPKLFGKRVIATIHGLDHRRAKWGRFASTYIMLGEKTAVKYADEIVVLSKAVEKYFKDTYGRDTNFIPNGVTRPEVRDDRLVKNQFGLEKEDYFLFLGRIVPEKGLRYLIEAFKKVRTNKKLVIAGGSSDTEEFVKEIREMAADDSRILFIGFVQGDLYESVFSNAYVYVLPSDLEGMPLSLLEAMSYGNCCLVSDIPECVEVVEEHGVIFERSNVEALREALQRLADRPELVQEYRDKAANYICQKYSWDDAVKQTLALYRQNRHI